MNEQQMFDPLVRARQAVGRWADRGRWTRERNGTPDRPVKREIAAKCRLFRTIAGWHGASKRAHRCGEFARATTAGIRIRRSPRLAITSPTRDRTDQRCASVSGWVPDRLSHRPHAIHMGHPCARLKAFHNLVSAGVRDQPGC